MQWTVAGDNRAIEVLWSNHAINLQRAIHRYIFTITRNFSNFMWIIRLSDFYVVFIDFSFLMKDTFVWKHNTTEKE